MVVNQEKPHEWCARMRDTAADGATAYHYQRLYEMWKEREVKDD